MASVQTITPDTPQPLDEVMLAMDVVDTLRHQEALVEKEMSEGEREATLVKNLREIYARQGIAVPDAILQQGVKSLREERFSYRPPAGGLGYSLAKLWVARGALGKGLLAVLAALGIGYGTYEFGYVRPREQAAQASQLELTQTLPKTIDTLLKDINQEALVDSAKQKAAGLAQVGRTAARDGNRDEARAAVTSLEALRNELREEFKVQVVSRPGEQTGVWRTPINNPSAQRSYYLIVEAIGPDGRAKPRAITGETNQKPAIVTKWGQRVSQSTYNRVAADKRDDGIIQNNLMGYKERGKLDIDWTMPVEGGAITIWDTTR